MPIIFEFVDLHELGLAELSPNGAMPEKDMCCIACDCADLLRHVASQGGLIVEIAEKLCRCAWRHPTPESSAARELGFPGQRLSVRQCAHC